VLPKDGLVKDIMACLQGDNTNKQKVECLKQELEEFHDSFCEQPYPCPTCCCEGESYVVLGTVDFMKTKCRVTTVSQDMISINEGRRYAMTFMFWQYYLGSFFPSIANFLDNPFRIFCQIMKIILEQLSKTVSGEEVLARAAAFTKVTKVHKMSEKEAKKVLAEHKVLYNRTITMTADRVLDIASRAIAMEKIEPKMKVDLVTDKTGKVLFYIPAAEVPEKEELHARLRETENTVKGLQKRIAALELEKKKK